MKPRQWNGWFVVLMLMAFVPGSANAQWWNTGGSGTSLVAGSDNNNPAGEGCGIDQYYWITFPEYDTQLQMQEPKSAGTATSATVSLVLITSGLYEKIDGCTGVISYGSSPGYPVDNWTWSRSSDAGSSFSGTCAGTSCTAYFTPTADGVIEFQLGGAAGWHARGSYRVITNSRLAYWKFNGSWTGEGGQVPNTKSGISNPTSWNDGALSIDGTGSYIRYPAKEPDGFPNIARNAGTVRFWFKPTAVTGVTRSLVDISGDSWNLHLNSSGKVELSTTGVLVTHPTVLTANQWYFVAVTYSSTSSTIYLGYLNGSGTLTMTSTTGTGVTSSGSTLNGFAIGNNYSTSSSTAPGLYDEFETFNYVISSGTMSSDFSSAGSLDSDGDGASNLAEVASGSNIYEADTDGDGHNDGSDSAPNDPTIWVVPPTSYNGADTTPPTIELWTPLNTPI